MNNIWKKRNLQWKISRLFSCVLIAVICGSAFFSNISADSTLSAKDFTDNNTSYEAVLYDNSNGLPTSEANAIAQTEEGFIWIGGYSGLIRYDGTNFNLYSSKIGISQDRQTVVVGTDQQSAL